MKINKNPGKIAKHFLLFSKGIRRKDLRFSRTLDQILGPI